MTGNATAVINSMPRNIRCVPLNKLQQMSTAKVLALLPVLPEMYVSELMTKSVAGLASLIKAETPDNIAFCDKVSYFIGQT